MTRRAWSMLRETPHYRRDSFRQGLKAAGYTVTEGFPDRAREGDVLVIWNRYGDSAIAADHFERAGGTVLVAENGYLGVEWNGRRWYALARRQHNGAGEWHVGKRDRWKAFGVEPAAWRQGGRELVVLPQRGIGPRGVAMPDEWVWKAMHDLQGTTYRSMRLRPHPGMEACVPLEQDLRDAFAVVTWGSGAALKALLAGIPAFYAFPRWIGAPAARLIDASVDLSAPWRGDRRPMLRRMAWAMWTVEEIAEGAPFKALCN